jgi:hypothetical protein
MYVKHGWREKLRCIDGAARAAPRAYSPSNSTMKQPTDQEERNEDKKKPEKENPSHGIDPEPKEPEMEVDQHPGERQKKNQNQKKDNPLAA